jgi:hypothetical protein
MIRIAPQNAHFEPSQPDVTAAKRPKRSFVDLRSASAITCAGWTGCLFAAEAADFELELEVRLAFMQA